MSGTESYGIDVTTPAVLLNGSNSFPYIVSRLSLFEQIECRERTLLDELFVD